MREDTGQVVGFNANARGLDVDKKGQDNIAP
jgi:hypothetical protein